ncbi:TlyA family RNA methyltransferase [Simplicispira suum]|uniref:Hemolysin n=1 Tax=Simplicispira suum TaxID=2109915 RepID=A0A2S0N0K7_9BURK|nr:TlyA family RNA methyltransferase [Simplicispira suum]AVO41669.1 hemolysin [Simplicispira suum]MBW7833960.1 TlyA family RNA methyltransferase [Simplicispira suum]
MRIDQLLVERGLAASRAQAQRLLSAGAQWRLGQGAWKQVAKNGDNVPEDAQVQLLDSSEARYVSRGGLKLEGALAATGLEVAGRVCLDIGQSTGGFTDCLLQQGAARVVGVDVGQGQLHPRLREDTRVICVEQVNARALDASDLIAACADGVSAGGQFDPKFEVIVGDLSFISLTLVLPALAPLLAEGGAMLMLVKPQFELQPGQVGKGGIVRDPALYVVVEQRIRACCAELGLKVQAWLDSPIDGGDGNHEFFIFARRAA